MKSLFSSAVAFASTAAAAYSWSSVKIGGGGGFVPGIVFNPKVKGLAYARTDIGGLYRLNADDSWTPLLDFVSNSNWNHWGVDSVATDPIDPARVYISVGMYTNSWDPNNGAIMRSADYGATWSETALPFKIGGNQPGRGNGERLAIDPKNNKIIYFAAPSGKGLYKSSDQGVTWNQVTSFPVVGDFAADPSDTTGYQSDLIGLTVVDFDTTSALVGGATSKIFVGVGTLKGNSFYISSDAGATWSAPTGQPIGFYPKRLKFSALEKAVYISYGSTAGPYDAGNGTVYRYDTATGAFKNITPAWIAANAITVGFGGLTLDAQVSGTVMVATDNLWSPDVQIFRSTDSGTTWTNIWDYDANHYTYNTDKAPWIAASRQSTDTKKLGWMVESLEIDPFDSDHWLYGTGLTIYGGRNLKSWPNVLVQSLADGVEETAILDLTCPPGGAPLLSGIADVSGFKHDSLTKSPSIGFVNPLFASTPSIDYAGASTLKIVRIGNDGSAGVTQISTSTDGASTWSPLTVTPLTTYGGKVAYSADGSVIVWRTAAAGNIRFVNGVQGTVAGTLGASALLKSDKVNTNYFYGADSNGFYVSSDAGATFATSTTVSGSPSDLKVHPSIAGDIWLSTSAGLFHSTDFGKTFTAISGITSANAIALGKGANAYPNIYGFVTTSGGFSLQMSADKGATWTSIQVPSIGFGAASANCLAASHDTSGLVFVGTNGRGIFYGTGSTGSSATTSTISKTSVASSTGSTLTTTSKLTSTSTSKTAVPTTTTVKTTLSTSTTKTTSSSSATATGSITKYAQCGGIGWTGTGSCVAGTSCVVQNAYYSQCL